MNIQLVNNKKPAQKKLAKIRKNFQLTIPQGLREKLGVRVGDYVELDLKKGSIVIRPVAVDNRIDQGRGEQSQIAELVYEEVKQI